MAFKPLQQSVANKESQVINIEICDLQDHFK